jgi:hypothetical protein
LANYEGTTYEVGEAERKGSQRNRPFGPLKNHSNSLGPDLFFCPMARGPSSACMKCSTDHGSLPQRKTLRAPPPHRHTSVPSPPSDSHLRISRAHRSAQRRPRTAHHPVSLCHLGSLPRRGASLQCRCSGSCVKLPSQGDRWAGWHETQQNPCHSPEPQGSHPRQRHRTPTHLGGESEPQERRAMAAMMMATSESKSPARVLRRLAGAAVAAVLLRRTFSASKWYGTTRLPPRCAVLFFPFLLPPSLSSFGAMGLGMNWIRVALAARRRRGWRRRG